MTFWPVQSFELRVPLPPARTRQLLSDHTRSSWAFWPPLDAERPLRGRVSDDGFHVVIDYFTANVFLAVIVGTIASDPSGSRVAVRLRLDFVSVLAAVAVFVFLASQLVQLLMGATAMFPPGLAGIGLALALFVGGYALVVWLFSLRARSSRILLSRVLAAPPQANKRVERAPRALS